ncbi:MAG: hypothetical protein J0I41_12580 [Filimonas sp.]|nr:hypothetical protein [Filimonas sp.]
MEYRFTMTKGGRIFIRVIIAVFLCLVVFSFVFLVKPVGDAVFPFMIIIISSVTMLGLWVYTGTSVIINDKSIRCQGKIDDKDYKWDDIFSVYFATLGKSQEKTIVIRTLDDSMWIKVNYYGLEQSKEIIKLLERYVHQECFSSNYYEDKKALFLL